MALRCGLVGLPNVGKSTIFNALSNAGAESANYPFCTIDPNVGVVPVPDDRLYNLAEMAESADVTPATIEFFDIAGLVEGASEGEGLGNKFLANIREVDAIVHVVRCFDDENVVHVSGSVNPVRDIEVINTELLLKDMESVEKRIEKQRKPAKSGDKDAVKELEVCEKLHDHLSDGLPARAFEGRDWEQKIVDELFLLTSKPVLYAANVDESALPDGNEHVDAVREIAAEEGSEVVAISAEVESQIAQLEDPEERALFLEEMGLEKSGLERLIRAAYDLLGLITFFTCGPKEARAWQLTKGLHAPQAAGKIHSDFEKGFIKAETIHYSDYEKHESEAAARKAGVMRAEGKEYEVKDGDVMLFRFNV